MKLRFCLKCFSSSCKVLILVLLVLLFNKIPYSKFTKQNKNTGTLHKQLEKQLDLYVMEDEEEIKQMRDSFQMDSDEHIKDRACKIPRINPYELEAIKLIRTQTRRKNVEKPKCLIEPSHKFISDKVSKIIKVREPRTQAFWRNTKSCCYVPYETNEGYDRIIKLSSCIPITDEETVIPATYDNINVLCSNHEELTYRDYFHFFRPDPEIEESLRETENLTKSDGDDHLSVIFLGLDSVSLTNFQRFLPKTRNYLIQNMSALEFIGLNKVGRGTMENLVPLLTGCQNINGKTVFPSQTQDCNLLWENFKEKGYRTVLSEEQFWYTAYKEIRHDRNGTHRMNYTNLPFLQGISGVLSKNYALNAYGCFEHQFAADLIADRTIQVAKEFQHKLYYHHIWSVLSTHEIMEYAKFLDAPYFRLMETLQQNNLLNNTLLIVFSDHGTISSDYSRTAEGLIEARVPAFYMIFPQWFRNKYSEATKNLQINTKALISPFDIHQTLRDLLDLSKILNSKFKNKPIKGNLDKKLGISLFNQIPFNRNCKNGKIPEEYCICWAWTQLDNPHNDTNVVKAVSFALDLMNTVLDENPKCIRLDLKKILNGRKRTASSGNVVYEIRFQVIPSNGIFGAVVRVEEVKDDGQIIFRILGEVERQNRYRGQNECLDPPLKDSGWLRTACYCRT